MPAFRVDEGGLVDTVTALQRQTILWFATDAARSAALLNPTRGLVTFVDARSAFEWWNGTTWQAW
jgi:hypothetical protein